MTSIAKTLTHLNERIFEKLELPIEHATVRVSDRPDLCQFQCNGAMACAKHAKKNPRDIAQSIVDILGEHDIFESIEIAGPGFINIDVKDSFIAATLNNISTDDRLGIPPHKPEKIVLDYGGPNIAKPMHVGHLRASIIGDTLRRIYKFAGYETVGDVHMGDWGTPMGMIISELEITGHDGDITMEALAEIYPKAAADCKADETRMDQARAVTKKLQDGDEKATKTWRQFIDVSIAGMKKNFDALGVHFDEWKGESDAHPFIAPMVEELKSKNIAIESDGAWVIDVAQESDKKEIPPLILLKSDGAVLYSTTDMATIIDRVKTHDPIKIIYVVDQRQSLHFEQVFRASLIGGLVSDQKPELIFAGFGTMNGQDGKPFKTRAGGVMRLEDLIQMGIDKAQERLKEAELAQDMDQAERDDIAHKVAIAAIKFADLQNNRIADYVFDLDRLTSFEGKTGPYLLYQAVRIKSLLRKAADQDINFSVSKIITEDADRSLLLLLSEFPDHFDLAMKNNTPHVLCDYVFKLAQEFSSFYGNCHILSEKDDALRGSRLAICDLTQKHITLILSILGIDSPERM